MGIFALHDYPQSQEVAFDYGRDFMCGDHATKCLCGSAKCRYSGLPNPEASTATIQLRPNCLPSVPDKYRAFLSVEETLCLQCVPGPWINFFLNFYFLISKYIFF
jgi:hypothetical protein